MPTIQFVVQSYGNCDGKRFKRGDIADVNHAEAEHLVKFGIAVITDAKQVTSASEETTSPDPTTSSEDAQPDKPDVGKSDGNTNTSRKR